MEYSKDNTMTRKEYLKSKKKSNFWLSKIKYLLFVIVVILLGVYVFKQLNVYNNVTKIANKVVEEAMLTQTMTMYYISEPYSKEGKNMVMVYKAYDKSRSAIEGTEDFTNIKLKENILYGVCQNKLYSIDLEANAKEQITDLEIKDYILDNKYIYIQTKNDVQKYNVETKELKQVIKGKTEKLLVSESGIYAIAAGKTEKSIIEYNLNGEGKKQLSEKYIVKSMKIIGDNIYFVNSKDSKLYVVPKNGGEIKVVSKGKTNSASNIVSYNDNIYYINTGEDNTLYSHNTKTGEEKCIVKKNVLSMQMNGKILYYSLNNGIGIYRLDIETGKTEQVTSVRTKQYICIN